SCCRANSNALLALNKNNSNTLLRLTTNNSEAILNLNNQIRLNSNALLTLATNNSNALLRLTTNNSQALLYLAKNNSNTILNGDLNQLRYTSNALLACCKNTSNSIVNLDSLIRVNSNASLAMNKNNSNTILRLTTNNSNAILNAAAVAATCCRVNSNALLYLVKNLSNTELRLFMNNSNTLLRLTINNSQAIMNLNNQIRVNSNSALSISANNSNALLRLTANNSQALVACCKNNSNTIINLTSVVSILPMHNSNAILYLVKNLSNSLLNCCKNSSSVVNNSQCCTNNSNAIISLSNRIANNSNAIITIKSNSNFGGAYSCCKDNSNAILYLTKHNSNAILEYSKDNSNALIQIKKELHCCTLVQAPVTTSVLMPCNCIVDPVNAINVVNTLTIDGQGAWIEFCSPTTPQFIVADGATVTLQNVTLTRINANTFSLGVGATIVLGDNVTFELSDDLTLNGQAFTVGGTIDNPFVWTIRGLGGKRRLTLAPNVTAGQYISLGFNTLLLQNIDLSGVENISITRGVNLSGALVTGALGFGGEAEVSLEEDTDATFIVEGSDNAIRMLDTGLALTGFILYSDIFDSELHLSFHLQTPIVGNPSINFGPDLLSLSSAVGRASIVFDDSWAVIVNQNSNSFVADAHAFIGGCNVEVNGFPIKQTSAGLVLDSGLNLYSDQPNAIDRSFIRGLQFRSQPRTHVITALDIKRMKEYEQMQDNIEVSSRPQKPKASSNRERQKQNKYGRRNSFSHNEIPEKGIEGNVLTRSFVSPASMHFEALKNYFQEQVKKHKTINRLFVLPNIFQLEQNGSVVKVENASDNILIHSGGVGLDFGIDPVNQLSLYLGNNVSGNGTVRQGFKDATLKQNDKIFVRSLNNRIQIQEHFTIQGEIVMTPGSELIFEFLDNGKDPVLFFDAAYNSFFDIAHDAQVRFTGRGKVIFGDGFIMRLEGGKLAPEKTRLLFDESVLVGLSESESTVIIDGDGKLLFDRGAQLNIRAGQHLIIGRLDEPTLPPDGIDITLNRGAEWNLNEDIDSEDVREGDARVSVIGSSTFCLRVNDEAKVYIGSQGVLEINAFFNERLEVPGVLTNLAFTSKGTLSFENGGQFVLGLNKNFVTTSVDTKKGILQTDSTGVAQFAARNDSVTVRLSNSSVVNQGNAFEGFVQDSGQFIGLKGLFSGRDIIRRLINIVPSLSFSTFFRNIDFKQGIELLGGDGSIQSPMRILALDSNDDIRSDDTTAGIVVGFNRRSLLTIDRLGNRQLH
ncbi:hypothetical protein JST56_04145, partial [Candidatus Dependentiae bacterium]|nr:hypothetical protein [Candidatus Dependentiae bacterium]